MSPQPRHLHIAIPGQRLALMAGESLVADYAISTSAAPPNEIQGSGGTPRGWHVIRAAIGAAQPAGTVFVGRRPTGEIHSEALAAREPGRDWILSRILWLSGLEPGRNRLGLCDTFRRYIYIHGTPDSEPMGEPLSHGCIRMRNADIITLFDQVGPGTHVFIQD